MNESVREGVTREGWSEHPRAEADLSSGAVH